MDPNEYDKISLMIDLKAKYELKRFKDNDIIEKSKYYDTLLLKAEKDKIKKKYLKK